MDITSIKAHSCRGGGAAFNTFACLKRKEPHRATQDDVMTFNMKCFCSSETLRFLQPYWSRRILNVLQSWVASDHVSIDKMLEQHFSECDFISLLGDDIFILKGSQCNQSFLWDMEKKA